MRGSLPGWVGLLVGALVLLLLPLVMYPVLALEIATWGLFAVALDLLLGFVGVLSFGHAAFWGTGGYTAGILAKQFGLAFPIAALIGMLAAVVLAGPFGYLSIWPRGNIPAMGSPAF